MTDAVYKARTAESTVMIARGDHLTGYPKVRRKGLKVKAL
jgi:hypothetical protein